MSQITSEPAGAGSPPRHVESRAAPGDEATRSPLVQLLRPKQWIKNTFVLAPLVFAGSFLDPVAVGEALLAAVLFSIAASAAYVTNDILDLENDRAHPIKRRTRPLAAGAVTVRQALAVLAVLLGVLLGASVLRPVVVGVIGLYLAINAFYSAKLKYIPVVDLFCIAAGFVLRVWVGALALSVPLSSWMLITTLSLALYLAAVKRRQELVATGSASRAVLGSYSVTLLDRYAEMSAVGAVIFYSLYVVEVRPELAASIPLVLFGVFRYWYIVEAKHVGESPTDAVYSDRPLLFTVILWVAFSAYAVWPV